MRKLCLLLLACLLLCGASSARAYTFTDALGRSVTVEHPQRVAALIGSFADTWALAGGAAQLAAVANDAVTDFEIDLPADIVNLGSSKKISLEALLSAEPDFILASSNTQADLALLETFEQLGIPAAYFHVSTFGEYLALLKLCTEITGQGENYACYGEAAAAQVEAAIARADGSRPSALYLRVSSGGYVIKNNQNSVLGEMLRDLDVRNIAESDGFPLESLNAEAVLREDPDFIFVILQGNDTEALRQVYEETVLSQPAFASLTAVREGRCYLLDEHLYNFKPNSRWGEAYAQLAEILYPQE